MAHPGFADTTSGSGRSPPGGWRQPCVGGSRWRAPVRARRRRHRRHSTGRRRRSRAGGTRARARRGPAPCAFCTWRRWHGSCTDRVASGVAQRQRGLRDEPLREVAHPLRERVRFGRAEQTAVVLHRRAAARAVDDDGRVTRERRDDAAGEPAREVHPPGMDVQGTATVATAFRETGVRARGAHDPERGAVDIALPRVHDASGEQIRVGMGRARQAGAQRLQRDLRQPEPPRHQAQSLPEPEREREREQQPMTRQHHHISQPLGDAPQRRARRGGRVRE